MSGELFLVGARLTIAPADEEEALAALHTDYADFDEVTDAESLDDAMEVLGWELDRDGEDVICGLADSQPSGEPEVFVSLGPFMQRGSFVLLTRTEDSDDLFGYVFTGKKCHKWDLTEEEFDAESVADEDWSDYEPDLTSYDEADQEEFDAAEEDDDDDSLLDDDDLDYDDDEEEGGGGFDDDNLLDDDY